jgi:general secretion pathway protein D
MGKDGMTMAVGGMFTETRTDNETKVPLLGDLPLLGALFKSVDKSTVKNELILLITPHVFNTPEEAEAAARERVGELTAHPNSIDIYLDRLDGNRGQSLSGQRIRNDIKAMTANSYDINEDLATLTRFAAEAVHLPVEKQPKSRHIFPVKLGQFAPVPLFPGLGVEAFPVKSWRMGALYVTAVGVRNKNAAMVSLNPAEVNGDWLAATLENEQINPEGQPGDTTYVFLVSSKPFLGAVP